MKAPELKWESVESTSMLCRVWRAPIGIYVAIGGVQVPSGWLVRTTDGNNATPNDVGLTYVPYIGEGGW